MSDRINKAIDRLAEALQELGYTGRISINPDARLLIGPGKTDFQDVSHLHVIGLSADVVELLADAVEKLLGCELYAAAAAVVQHNQMAKHVDDVFAGIDLNELTTAVLNETAPQDRLTVTRALDDLFGAIPTEDDEEAED